MRSHRYALLLGSLLSVVFVRPFLEGLVVGVAVVDALLLITLLTGSFAAIERRRTFLAIAALGLVSAGAQGAFLTLGWGGSVYVFLCVSILFYAMVAWVLLRALFGEQGAVTGETICQAFSVYMLIGMMGAMAYALLELTTPGSFDFPPGHDPGDARFDRFLGFSLTTLTTLGYGNISPATPRSDAVCTLQAVLGQAYLAIVIARLVAIQVGQRRPGPEVERPAPRRMK